MTQSTGSNNQRFPGSRIVWLDLVKLFAIILVVMGHCVQQFDSDYQNTPLFLFIYSFHMPLFMMLSGFFLDYDKILGSPWRFTKKRFLQLILPSLVWLTIVWLIEICIGKSHESLLRTVWSGLWFLKSLFACNVLLIGSLVVFRNKPLAIIIALIVSQISLFVHSNGFLHLHIMFPCLIAGGLVKRYLFDSRKYRTWLIVVVSAGVFIALLQSFGPEQMLRKLSRESVNSMLSTYREILLYKVLLGITGGITVIGLFKIAFERIDSTKAYITNIAGLGQFTLEIYILQTIILEVVMSHFMRGLAISDAIAFFVFPILVLILCIGLIKAFKIWKIDFLFNFNKLR